jgi:hypothetical protein
MNPQEFFRQQGWTLFDPRRAYFEQQLSNGYHDEVRDQLARMAGGQMTEGEMHRLQAQAPFAGTQRVEQPGGRQVSHDEMQRLVQPHQPDPALTEMQQMMRGGAQVTEDERRRLYADPSQQVLTDMQRLRGQQLGTMHQLSDAEKQRPYSEPQVSEGELRRMQGQPLHQPSQQAHPDMQRLRGGGEISDAEKQRMARPYSQPQPGQATDLFDELAAKLRSQQQRAPAPRWGSGW